MASERASQRAFFGVSALLFAASAATTIVWCASMSAMGRIPMPGRRTMSMAWMRMPGQPRPIAGENMSEAYTGGSACGAIRYESSNAAALGAADWPCLAAAPTFAIMALLTGVLGGGPSDMLCSAARDASPLSGMVSGMVPMYLLMGAVHSAPWLKLISSRRSGARRSRSGVRQIEVPNLPRP